ncbi:hypothetical protein ACROYT_G027507 [Oculina patagonica]
MNKVRSSSTKKGARQLSKLSEESPFSRRMGDNVGDPFDDIDSGDEDLEKPPTPEIHHGGESPDAPGFSDISDNESEEKTKGEAPTNQSEDSNDSVNVNSPVEEDVNEKEESAKEEKESGSPLYDQEMSPVSSTSATAEEQETTVEKGEQDAFSNEEESSSLSTQKHADTTPDSESKQEHSAEVENEITSQPSAPTEMNEETSEGQSGGKSNDAQDATERRRTISSGAATDDDLEMPISPLGLGLSGPESEIVDDILKSDVSKLLPDNKDESQEDTIEQNDDDEETKEEKSFVESEAAEQDEEGLESGEEAGEQLIADIFGASDEEEEFVGFGQEDIEVTKKKKGARDRKHHTLSVGSEIDDEEGPAAKDSVETMKVPKPKSSKQADSDSDDDAFDDKQVPVEAAPDIPATAATGTPITIPTPVSEVATAPEDRAAVTAPRQTTE